MRIPFDSVALSAIVSEINCFVGGFVQEIRQPDEHTVTLTIYRRTSGEKGQEGMLLLCSHPQFARTHFVTRRPPNSPSPPVFCATLRARIQGSELVAVRQVACDRILWLTFASENVEHHIVFEMMGKHSNLMLLDGRRHVVSAAKWVPKTQSSRPILSNSEYLWPPVVAAELIGRTSPTNPEGWVAFAKEPGSRVSPFFKSWIELDQPTPREWSPQIVLRQGVYPFPLQPLGLEAHSRASLSIALEQYYSGAEASFELEAMRGDLLAQIDRVLLARDVAIDDLTRTLKSGEQAEAWQRTAELILAYGPSALKGASVLEVWDYEGNPLSIKVNPELAYAENAAAYFERAKKAKLRASYLEEQSIRMIRDRQDAVATRGSILAAKSIVELEEIRGLAKGRKWLMQQAVAKAKEDRPYEGHRIRELMGPGGIRVLFGENAESNDYLTLRVAKPNDYWLHVRGSTSAHVVILTGNKPEKIGKEHLMFAAKIAVLNSTSKHAGYVPVDYTLKKYVRKQRGAAKGSATYTNEKTLHIES